MTDEAKALVELLRDGVLYGDARLHNPKGHDPLRMEAADRIEALSAENERLREALIGIRANIDDMENPFNGDGNPEMRQGFEVAVDQAFNIVTAALEGEE